MRRSRRRFLQALPALAAGLAQPLRAAAGRVVVIGGGWGGLAAAAELRRLAPALDVTVLEPEQVFFSLPLSNALLAGKIAADVLRRPQAAAAARHGYRLLPLAADAIDRDRRRVHAGGEALPWDWLVLATGIRHDYAALTGGDRAAADEVAARWGGAMDNGRQVLALADRLAAFDGGELLMCIPAGPQRCPPAPYERAAAILHQWQQRGIRGRLTLLDAGAGMAPFRRTLVERHADRVRLLPHAAVTAIDVARKQARTEFETFPFDEAIIVPPAQAHPMAAQAGLLEAASPGRAAGWVAVDPAHWHAAADDRIYPVGDLLGTVSPLFGPLPKTAQVAVSLGRIAAAQIAARAAGRDPAELLPESLCHVTTDYALPEGLRIDAQYRRRGDGAMTQSVRQARNAQPRGEDRAWLEALLAALF